jgi:NAD dependent epimerase/dehydratase family enzyme
MVRVAIAGGTGHLGRTLVEGLVESGDHDIFVLTRAVRISYLSSRILQFISDSFLTGHDYI